MSLEFAQVTELDPVWARIVQEAKEAVQDEPLLGGMMHGSILHYATIEQAMAYRIASKLANPDVSEQILREICDAAYLAAPELAMAAAPILWRSMTAMRHVCAICSLCCISKGFRERSATGLPIISGIRGGAIWPIFCKIAVQKCSGWISTPLRLWARV